MGENEVPFPVIHAVYKIYCRNGGMCGLCMYIRFFSGNHNSSAYFLLVSEMFSSCIMLSCHSCITLKLNITSLRRLIDIVTSFPLKIDGIGIETSAIKTRQNCSAPQP